MITRSEMMESSAQSELRRYAENFLEKLTNFQQMYPKQWQEINQNLYAEADLNIADLINLLQVFSEIAK